jgi:phosphoserine phosphatase
MADAQHDLQSWADTPTRQAIERFVKAATDPGSPEALPVPERVAVFDNDGTLWSEKPMPIQLAFTIRLFAEQAEADPSLQEKEPYRAACANDLAWFGNAMVKHYHGDDSDLHLLMGAVNSAFAGITIEQLRESADAFFANGVHPLLKRPYVKTIFQPMLELLRYLEKHDFTCYIASGGDRDFMRSVGEDLYAIPPERIIGSSQALEYRENADGTDVLYKPEIEVFDDGPAKPVRIWSRIGRRPVIAGGNSNGDMQMLRFANAPSRPALRLLINHDDAEREFDYQAGAEEVLQRAAERGWTVVSMKRDWTVIFPE